MTPTPGALGPAARDAALAAMTGQAGEPELDVLVVGGGITVPFDPITLQQRYPTFADYERQLRQATNRAVRKGWLLPVDARDQMRRACAVKDRYPGSGDECRSYRPPRFGG